MNTQKAQIQILEQKQVQSPTYAHTKVTSHVPSPSAPNFGQNILNQPAPQKETLNHHAMQKQGASLSKARTQSGQQKKDQPKKDAEEEKVIAPTQYSHQPLKPMHSYELNPLDRNSDRVNPSNNIQNTKKGAQQYQISHKPNSSQSSNSAHRNDSRTEDGEKRLKQKQQMKMPSREEQKRMNPQHNITRSLIEEGSEDFTNIEEHINDDTKISCRNAVMSSLNNVSVVIKKNVYSSNHATPTQQQLQQMGIRQRRGTTQSNMSGNQSNQVSKEETFETSSFFDERCGSNRMTASSVMNGASPHKCNQVDGYNIPTIFNALIYGMDKEKVSSNVKSSFQDLNQKQQNHIPLQQMQTSQQPIDTKSYQQQLSSQFAKKKMSDSSKKEKPQKESLSNFITKVEKGPIVIYDNSQVSQIQKQKEPIKKKTKTTDPKKSQLSVAALSTSTPTKHEQAPIEQPDSLKSTQTEMQLMSISSQDVEEEHVANHAVQQIEDFQSSELHRNHLIQTLQSLQYIKTLPNPQTKEIKSRQVMLPPPKGNVNKKTIIFDLDETLVHCIDDIDNHPCDQVINVTFPNGESVQAGINVRPYAIECLRKANENYQVVIFTASHKAYADVVLNNLDPDGSLIQYRLYREHCIRTEEGIYIKDLRIIANRKLKDLIIVDNAVYSFGYQLDNGIPIIPFYDDKNDEELMHLIYYFNCLAQCADVREQNRKAFQLKDLQEIDIAEYLQSMMQQQQHVQQQE